MWVLLEYVYWYVSLSTLSPGFPHCPFGVGLVQWFSTNSINTAWELNKNASFWVPYQVKWMRNSQGSREGWISVYSNMKCSVISSWRIQPNVWKTWRDHHQQCNCETWQNSFPGHAHCSLPHTCLSIKYLLIHTYAKSRSSSQVAQLKVHVFSQQILVECLVCAIHCAMHRGHIVKMTVIGPWHWILCRGEKSIWRAESGTFFWLLMLQLKKKKLYISHSLHPAGVKAFPMREDGCIPLMQFSLADSMFTKNAIFRAF